MKKLKGRFLSFVKKSNGGGASINPPIKPENENNNSLSHHQTNKPDTGNVSTLVEVDERDAKVDFSHVRCHAEMSRLVIKQALERGVVVVRCSGCDDLVPVADHAHLFGDGAHDKVDKYLSGLRDVVVPSKGSDSSLCATFESRNKLSRQIAEMKGNNINTPEQVSKEKEEEEDDGDLGKALIREGNTTPEALLKLPLDIFLKIISMLSIKPLAVSRAVCKTWLQIISHPSFTKLHHPPNCIVLYQFKENQFFLKDDKTCVLITFAPPDFKFTMVGSSRGLLCLSDQASNDPIYICNPVTGEYFILPKVGRDGAYIFVCGFGFDQLSNKYKVIRLICYYNHNEPEADIPDKLEVEIYTLGSGQWRKLGDAPYPLHETHAAPAPLQELVNGAFHWLRCNDNESMVIVAFDIGGEEFREVTFPPIPKLNRPFWEKMSLGNFRGSLCLLDYTSDFDCVVWLMKDYGVGGSWMIKDVITQSINPRVPLLCTLLGGSETGEIMILVDKTYIVHHDPTTKTTYKTGPILSGEVEVEFNLLFHVPSFVSLQDIVKPTSSRHRSNRGRWYGALNPISTNQFEELKMRQAS